MSELEDVVVNTAPRKLIQSTTIEQAVKALAARKEHFKALRAKLLGPMLEVYRRNDPSAPDPSEIPELDDLKGTPLEALLGDPAKRPSCFSASPRLWQATLLVQFAASSYDMSLGQWLVNIADTTDGAIIKSKLRYLKADDALWIRENLDPTFRTAYEEAEDFMGHLVKNGMAQVSHRKGRWYHAPELRAQWSAILKPKRMMEDRRNWLATIREKILEASGVGCFDKDGPEFEAWLEGRAVARRKTVKSLLSDAGAGWEVLEANLKSLYRAMRTRNVSMTVDNEGLPVERFFASIRNEIKRRDELNKQINERHVSDRLGEEWFDL